MTTGAALHAAHPYSAVVKHALPVFLGTIVIHCHTSSEGSLACYGVEVLWPWIVRSPVTTSTNGVEDDFSSLLVSWPLLAASLAAESGCGVFEAAPAAAGPLPAGGFPAVAGVFADKLLGPAQCGVLLGRPCVLMLELVMRAQELRGVVQHNQGRGMQQLLCLFMEAGHFCLDMMGFLRGP